MPETHFDVIIVGFGPAGATLANLLGMSGVSTLVLEREADTYHLPRAVHFDDEVMRVFQTIGLAEEVASISIVNPGAHFLDPDGNLLLDWSRPKEPGPQGWNRSYRFHQPDLEKILRRGADRFGEVEIRTRADVFAFDEDEKGVCVRYEDLNCGQLRAVRGQYVVGCDGARSLVRRFMGAEMDDLGFHERWLVVDVVLHEPKPQLGVHTTHRCGAERPLTMMQNPGNRRRWEIRTTPEDDPRTFVTPANVWNLLSEWLSPEEAELERAALYTFHSTIAKTWRNRRLMLCGDAAHQTPPFMGQGMCAGIRDVDNLGWKLAAVIEHRYVPSLLDTYQSERAPNVRTFIETAVRLGEIINGSTSRAAFSIEDGVARMKVPISRLGITPNADKTVTATLAPQPRLSDGRLLDDCVGYHFALVVHPDHATDRLEHEAARRGIIVVADRGTEICEWLISLDAIGVVVRPDRYVLDVATDAAALDALPARVDGLGAVVRREEAGSEARA